MPERNKAKKGVCDIRAALKTDECHTRGMDAIVGVCLSNTSRNPMEMLEELMSQPFCHMHGPEHHTIVEAALLTAYRNAGERLTCPPR